MSISPWRVAMASSIGQSHVAAAQPCQDTHFHLEVPDADGEERESPRLLAGLHQIGGLMP